MKNAFVIGFRRIFSMHHAERLAALCLLLFTLGIGNAWGDDVTDAIQATDLTATSTTYTDFSNVSKVSDAKYAGNSAKDASGNIQMRSKNSNSGIVSTTSGGKVKSVKITVGSGSNTIDVYGSNTAYTAASDLYGDNKGTKLGSVTATGTVNVTGDYKYVGIRSNSGAIYLSKVEITWTTASSATLSSIAITTQPTTTEYLVGETFSKAGAVVTATYSDATTANVSASATWTPTTSLVAGSNTMTASYTEGGVTKTATTTVTAYAVTVQKKDEDGTTIADAGVSASASGRNLTASAGSTKYVFKTWKYGTQAGTSLTNATSATTGALTGTPSGAVTVIAEFYKPVTVTWNKNGAEYETTTVARGSKLVFPSNPSSCDATSTAFYGWATSTWSGTVDALGGKTVYTSADDMPAVTGPVTYNAVFAKATDNSTPASVTSTFNSNSWGDSGSLWTSGKAGNQLTSGRGVQITSGVSGANATTKSSYSNVTSVVVTYSTNASSGAGTISIEVGGTSTTASATVSTSGGTSDRTITYTPTTPATSLTGNVKITVTCTTNSIYVKSVQINYSTGSTTYSKYMTTCAASHTVSPAVNPAGKATVTLGANSVAEGGTTTAEYSAITAGYEFVNWTISGTGANLSSTTANPTTITMGTANVTVTANLQCITPSITVHPASKTDYIIGDVATALGVTASAGGASLGYQWQVSNNNSDWSDIAAGDGGTAATYTPSTAAATTKYYRVKVTNAATGCNTNFTSNAATITVSEPSGYCISLFNSSNNGIQSGFSNGGSGYEYTLDFTVPGKDGSNNWPQYWIGENNAWASFSDNATLADMPLVSATSATLGLAEGATGKLHIWDDNKASTNLSVKFEPDGYGLRWGGAGEWDQAANTKAFTVDPNNANTYWTDMVTLDGTNNTTWNYFVGLQSAGGYVYSGVDNEGSDSRGLSRTRSVTGMKVSNGTAGSYKATYLDSEATGSKGKFRIWDNNISDYNFVCHWVPFYEASYDVNGGSAISPAAVNVGPVCCEGSASERQVIMPAAPSYAHHDFGGWKSSADNSIKAAGGTVSLTQNTTFTAQWTNSNYNISATLTNINTVTSFPVAYTYTGAAANVTYTFTAASGYRLPDNVTVTGSTHTWDKTTGELTLTGTITGAVSISITGVQTHTVTWLSNGSDYVTPVTYDHGATLAFPAGEPSAPASCSGKTFVGWTSDSEITSETSTAPSFISAGGAVNADATYRAVFATSAGSGATQWSETSLAELTGSDVFVIATPSNYAIPNNGGSSNAPAAISINVLEGKITSSVANELKWNVSGNATDGYVFYPNGSTTTWLYCNTTANSSSNDNIRVGAGTRRSWKLDANNYLVTKDDYVTRYLSMYIVQDFRSYVNTNNGVFEPKFYKYSVDISYTNYITTCSSDPTLGVEPTALDFGNVAVNSSKDMTFTLSGSNLTSNATISVTGAGYSVSPASVSKGSGTISSENITVTYQPTVTGDSQTGTVTISSPGADDKTVSLTGNSKAAYTVSLPSPSNGIVTADKTSGIIAGETVTLTITPSSGYQLANISAADGSSNDVSLTGTGNTRTFTMPASNVTVTATFMVRTDYVLVTNISQLSDGDIITIATMKGNNAEGYIMHDTHENGNWRDIKSVTTTANGKIADTDVEYPILLEHAGEVWKLYDQRNEGYLYAYRGSNYLKTGTSIIYNQEWIIEITQTEPLYKALIHQQACNASADCTAESNHRYIEFNNDRFSGYLGTQTNGYIYKKELGCDRLPAPTGLSATAVTQTTCTLSWTAVANASGYEVSLDNGSSWTSAGTNTSYNATGLTQGTTYNWKVRATGTGDYCDKGTAAANTVTMKKAVTVTYDDNGATEGQLPVTGGVVNLTEDDSYTILGNTGNGGSVLSKDGYTFDGWHSSSTYNATPAYTIGGTVTVTANITLYANWKPKRDTFIDGVHGAADQYGDGAGYTVPSCSDQSRATSGDCEQTHYKFIGWALMGADLTSPANIITAGSTKTATGATYYAVWGEEL